VRPRLRQPADDELLKLALPALGALAAEPLVPGGDAAVRQSADDGSRLLNGRR
jgi:hypothetical protein